MFGMLIFYIPTMVNIVLMVVVGNTSPQSAIQHSEPPREEPTRTTTVFYIDPLYVYEDITT